MGRGGSAGGGGAGMKTSVCAATMALLKASAGPGCLSLAYAASKVGVVWASCFMALLQLCCVHNMHLMTNVKQHFENTGAKTYGDLGFCMFGKRGRQLVEFFVSLQQLGICCVYFEFVSSNVDAVLCNLGVLSKESRFQINLICLAVWPILANLALIRHWKRLAPISTIANGAMVGGIAVVMAFTVPVLLRDGISPDMPRRPVSTSKTVSGLALMYGAVVYSYECACSVLPIENSMMDPSHVNRVIHFSQLAYFLIMQLLVVLPLMAFGHIELGSLPAELGTRYTSQADQPWIVAMNLLVTVAVILTYPLQFYPVIEVIEARLGLGAGAGQAAHDQALLAARGPGRPSSLASLGASMSVSTVSPSFVGSTKDYGRRGSLMDMPRRGHTRVVACRVIVRFTLVLGTMAVAVAVPHLGPVITLFGSFNASLLSMILPPIMAALSIDTIGRKDVWRRPLHWAIAVLGMLGAAMGTLYSAIEILAPTAPPAGLSNHTLRCA